MCAMGGLHECMHVAYVCNVFGNCVLFKASSKGISAAAKLPYGFLDRAHTKLREKERHSDRRLQEALALTLM